MDEIVQKLGWKKLTVILVVLGVIASVLLFLSFTSSGRDLLPSQNSLLPSGQATPVSSGNQTNNSGQDQSSTNSGSAWSTYKTATFEIGYPKGWTAQEYNLQNGSAVYFSSQSFSVSIYKKILVEVVPTQKVSLAKRREQFLKAGFKETPMQTGDTIGMKFVTLFPLPVGNSKVILQESYTIIEKKGMLYVIGYEYDSQEKNPQEEAFFDKVVAGFQAY